MYHAYREASRNPQKEHLASAARAASHIPSLSFTFLIIFVLVLLSSPFSHPYHRCSRFPIIAVLVLLPPLTTDALVCGFSHLSTPSLLALSPHSTAHKGRILLQM